MVSEIIKKKKGKKKMKEKQNKKFSLDLKSCSS